MSVADLLSSLPKNWLNINVNSINTDSANLNNGPLTNVASINGIPITPISLDANSVNIIYQPGSTPVQGSNIVQTWEQVLAKASQINVNQLLNIYVDDSIVSPVIIDQSHDFKGRANLYPIRYLSSSGVQCEILDGVVISNLLYLYGPITLNCNSVTGPNLAFDNSAVFPIENGAQIKLTSTATQSAIQINNKSMVLGSYLGATLDNSLNEGIGVISLVNHASLNVALIANPIGNGTLPVSCSDATCSLNILTDASNNASLSTPLYTAGSKNFSYYDSSAGITYNDFLVNPQLGSNFVQGAIDALKSGGGGGGSFLPLAGGTMSGDINMNTNNISNVNILSTSNFQYAAGGPGQFYVAQPYSATLSDGAGNQFTLSTNNCRIVSIGSFKYVNYWLVWSSKGSASGNIRVSLPSTISSSCPRPCGSFGNMSGLTYSNLLVASAATGNSFCEFFQIDNAGGSSVQMTDSNFSSTGEFQMTFIYESA